MFNFFKNPMEAGREVSLLSFSLSTSSCFKCPMHPHISEISLFSRFNSVKVRIFPISAGRVCILLYEISRCFKYLKFEIALGISASLLLFIDNDWSSTGKLAELNRRLTIT